MRKLMWFTIGFGAACAWGAYFDHRFWLLLLAVVAVSAVASAVIARRNRGFRVAVLLCIGLMAGLSLFAAFDYMALAAPRSLNGETVPVKFRVSDYSQQTDYGYTVDAKLELDGKEYDVWVYLNKQDPPLQLVPGDTIEGEFKLRFTVGTDTAPQFQGKGIFLTASQRGDVVIIAGSGQLWDFPAVLRERIVRRIDAVFPGDTAGFAKALLLGDTSGLSYEVDTAFKISGIRHIVAVSGLHVSILFSALYLLGGKRRVLTGLLGIPVLLLFAALAGFTPSVTRACVMQILMILALLVDREYDPPTALSFAVLLILSANPLAVTSVSLQLSVGCIIGILLFSGRIRNWILSDKCIGEAKGKGLKARLKRWFAGSVSVTLSTMVTTTPLCAWYFGMVSLVGILTNLLTLWIVTFLFCGILLVCLSGAVWTPLASLLAWIVSWGIRYVVTVARLLSELPIAAVYTKSVFVVIWLVFVYVLLIVFAHTKKKMPAVFSICVVWGLCVSLLVSWSEPLFDECRVTVLDVGQGQCVMLQSDGRNFMVDCGGMGADSTADEAAETLLAQGITKLDGIIVTHFDKDHCEGVANLLSRMGADIVLLPVMEDVSGRVEAIVEAADGNACRVGEITRITFGDACLTVIPSYMEKSDNESGLCVLFQTQNCAILITGDRDAFGERMLLHNVEIPDIDVLIVGHHGSRHSTSELLLEVTRPEIAMISVGADNPHGHPADEILQRLKAFGCVVYRTDLHGTIIYRG